MGNSPNQAAEDTPLRDHGLTLAVAGQLHLLSPVLGSARGQRNGWRQMQLALATLLLAQSSLRGVAGCRSSPLIDFTLFPVLF